MTKRPARPATLAQAGTFLSPREEPSPPTLLVSPSTIAAAVSSILALIYQSMLVALSPLWRTGWIFLGIPKVCRWQSRAGSITTQPDHSLVATLLSFSSLTALPLADS